MTETGVEDFNEDFVRTHFVENDVLESERVAWLVYHEGCCGYVFRREGVHVVLVMYGSMYTGVW